MTINFSLDNKKFSVAILSDKYCIDFENFNARLLVRKEERMEQEWAALNINLIRKTNRWLLFEGDETGDIEAGQYEHSVQVMRTDGSWMEISKGRLNYELSDGQANPPLPDTDCADAEWILINTNGEEISSGAIGSGLSDIITAPDSQITIQDKFQNVILQDSIPSNNSKTFTVNTELPVKNTAGDEVGTEINEEIIVGDSRLIAKDSAGNNLGTAEIPAEETREIVLPDSVHIVKNQDGKILIETSLIAGQHKTSEIWAKDYRPLIFKYDTRLSGDNEIILSRTGNYEKHITIKDMQGDILEEYWTTDNNIVNTNHQVGEYFVEVRQRAGNYYSSNTNAITNQVATLTEIVQFGDVIWDTGDLNYLYRRCNELIITAKDVMKFRDGVITGLIAAFDRIKGVAETTWLEQFPWSKVQGNANGFFSNTPNFAKDILELDFKDADILAINNFFTAYQIGGGNGIQTLIIKNMETCVNMTGNIIGPFAWTNGMQKVIFQGLQVSQDMTAWRPADPVNIMLFFLNLGDRTGETQSTITIRTQEWDLLTQEQKDVVEDILVNKNWALSLI